MRTLTLSIAPIALAAMTVAGSSALAQTPADRDAVRQAALDYVEGIYDVQPDRIRRSVHTNLVKRGFSRRASDGTYVESPMTFDELVKLAGEWNKERKRDTSVKEVAVLEVNDQTAVAKVTASWGIDYMLLGKYNGQWKIQQILWQSPPPKPTSR